MTSVTLAQAIAATRFGFGAKPDELSQMGDPKAWLKGQVAAGGKGSPYQAPSFVEYAEQLWGGVPSPTMTSLNITNLAQYEMNERLKVAQNGSDTFRERLVHFWSNIFSVSNLGQLSDIVFSYEREAIRPNVMGSFEDLLVAATKHPIMLSFLQASDSVGAQSPYGSKFASGINENLGRETLELHSIGVNGGYTQADVIALSNGITGWTYTNPSHAWAHIGDTRPYGRQYFEPAFHEPGAQTFMGKSYAQTGLDQGLAMLHDVVANPATATRICTKLAHHFHSDDPPQSLIDQMTAAWNASGGNLGSVYNAMIDAPEMWTPTQGKVKSTDDFVASLFRSVSPQWIADYMPNWCYIMMGQVPCGARNPAGYSDNSSDWASPTILKQRIDVMANLADLVHVSDPVSLADQVLGPLLSSTTRAQIQNAPRTRDAVMILFMSPEFQRR